MFKGLIFCVCDQIDQLEMVKIKKKSFIFQKNHKKNTVFRFIEKQWRNYRNLFRKDNTCNLR